MIHAFPDLVIVLRITISVSLRIETATTALIDLQRFLLSLTFVTGQCSTRIALVDLYRFVEITWALRNTCIIVVQRSRIRRAKQLIVRRLHHRRQFHRLRIRNHRMFMMIKRIMHRLLRIQSVRRCQRRVTYILAMRLLRLLARLFLRRLEQVGIQFDLVHFLNRLLSVLDDAEVAFLVHQRLPTLKSLLKIGYF